MIKTEDVALLTKRVSDGDWGEKSNWEFPRGETVIRAPEAFEWSTRIRPNYAQKGVIIADQETIATAGPAHKRCAQAVEGSSHARPQIKIPGRV